jgi:hypothetical protein
MRGSEELHQIPGIGPARARWLEASFGVRGLRDLAALAPKEIEQRLKAEGRIAISSESIESWVAEAKSRVSALPAGASAEAHPEKESDWSPLASFVVEFQTRDPGAERRQSRQMSVHHVEKDRDERWLGFDCAALCDWMTRQLDPVERAPVEPAPQVAVRASQTEEPRAHIEDVRAHVVDSEGVERSRLIRADRPWAVVLQWRSGGGHRADATGEWHVEALATRIGAGAPLRLPGRSVRPSVAGDDELHQTRLEFPAGAVTAAHLDTPYRVTVTIAYRRQGRALYVGFADVGVVRFYVPRSASETRAGASHTPND